MSALNWKETTPQREVTDLWDAIENIHEAVTSIRDTFEDELIAGETLEYVDECLDTVAKLLEQD